MLVKITNYDGGHVAFVHMDELNSKTMQEKLSTLNRKCGWRIHHDDILFEIVDEDDKEPGRK